jgi:glycosyltransferase involved in cell wall biosynthesis
LVSVIIPCYNEEGNVEECIRRVPELPYSYEIIVVDDGSKDRTTEFARRVNRKGLKVIRYEKNGGKGHAVRTGIENAEGEIVVIQDADMATQPEEIPQVVEPIIEGRADFVNATRLTYPMERGAMRGVHVLGNKIFALMVSALVRKRLTDTLCGFKAFRKKDLDGKLKEDSWPDFELLIKAKKNGMRIAEVPIHYNARRAGKSKMKTFRHGYKMFRMLAKSLLS